MQYRQYRSDVISVVGFGGICVAHETPQDARRIVDEAIRRGVTYFDVAPTYANAEERLGPALEPYRQDVFLACKTTVRDAAGADAEFENSLRLLRTDHFDLYQIHAIQSEEEVDQVLAPGGTLEMIQRRRDAGQVRYIGFSAHNEDAALRLLDAFPFDSVLFPVNRVIWHAGNVGPRLLEAARSRGAEILALKALALRRWEEGEEHNWSKTWYKPADTFEEAELGLRFTLSRPVAAAVSPSHEEHLWWACEAADRFVPLSAAEEAAVAVAAREVEPIFSRSVVAI